MLLGLYALRIFVFSLQTETYYEGTFFLLKICFGTGEPGGLPSMGSRRVGHDWSDLAAAAAACSDPFGMECCAWKIPWMEEPGRLQSMGSRRVGHDWATSLSLFTFVHWRRKWQPTPVFLPGESLLSMGSHRVRHDWSDLAAVFHCAFGPQRSRHFKDEGTEAQRHEK